MLLEVMLTHTASMHSRLLFFIIIIMYMCRLCEAVSVCGSSVDSGGDLSAGETGSRGGDEGREGSRVRCLSALVPVLASHPSLHHLALSGEYR